MKAIRKAPFMQALVLLALLPSFAWLPATGYANPFGEIVIHGDVAFSRDGNTLNINQFSDKAIIHWEDFSIGANEMTVFLQPGSGSSALNRVTGPNASNIMGALQANGNVWLINPNGILFGPGSVVDVNGLLASTLDVSNEDFLNGGDIHLHGLSNASVKNFGTINAAQGDIFFAGQTVENHGYLGAIDGRVVMAGGGDILIGAGPNGNVFINGTPNGGAHVLQDGEVVAPEVYLAAKNNNAWAAAVNAKGAIRANKVTNKGGRVVLEAIGGSGVNVSGTINADGEQGGGEVEIIGGEITISNMVTANSTQGDGGRIMVQSSSDLTVTEDGALQANGINGGEVSLNAANELNVLGEVSAKAIQDVGGLLSMSANSVNIGGDLDVSGPAGGGEIKVGGGLQGQDASLVNSQSTSIQSGATLKANATDSGNGGQVVVWSDGSTDFQEGAAIEAKGAGQIGRGGFAEVSGVDTISFAGAVDLSGEAGNGTLLIDPTDVRISADGQGGDIQQTALLTALGTGNVVIHTTGTGGVGNIHFDFNNSGGGEFLLYDSDNDLSFFAHEDIIWDGILNNEGAGSVNLVAGWGGEFTFGAGPNDAIAAAITAQDIHDGVYGTWGNSGGDIIFNQTTFRTASVGTRNGETNLFADLITGQTGNGNGEFIQIGFVNAQGGTVGDKATYGATAGDINVYAATALTLTGTGGNTRYIQIGHGGVDIGDRDPFGIGLVNPASRPDGNINGNITVDGGLALIMQGPGNDSGYKMIGHGGGTDEQAILGNLSGDIDVTAGVVRMEAGNGTRAWTMIGHGGYNRRGEHSGDINVEATLGDIVMSGANEAAGNHSFAFAQIGHGGHNSEHFNGSPIDVVYQSTTPGQYDYSPFATGVLGENRLGFEIPTVGQVNDRNAAEGNSAYDVDASVVVNGVSGLSRKVGHHGDITVTAARSVRFTAGSDNDDYAKIGHGGRDTMGEFVGDITVEATNGSVVFDRDMRAGLGEGARAYVQIGHGGWRSAGGATGHIDVMAGAGTIEMYGGRLDSFAQIGHGGRQDIRGSNNQQNAHDNNFAQGTLSGNVTVDASGNIILRSGFGRGATMYSQIGHGGFEASAGIDETQLVVEDINYDGDTTDNNEDDNYLGEGHNGDITVRSGGYIDLYAGQREFAVMDWVETSPGVFELVEILPSDELRSGQLDYESNPQNDAFTMIGHGGRRSSGDHYGAITVEADGLISIEATGGWDALGYSNNPETAGGANNENDRGEVQGDVDPESGLPGVLRYGATQNGSYNGDRNFAQIGHGGSDSEHLGLFTGDQRDRTGANSRGFGYLGDSPITITSYNGGLRVVAAQLDNIGRQRDQMLTYDVSAGWVDPSLNPTQTNFTNRIDPLTGLLLPGAVVRAQNGYAMVGHGGQFSDIRGTADAANTGRGPGHYGDITIDVAGNVDVIASDFFRSIEPGSAVTNATQPSFFPTWVVGDLDNGFNFNWEKYDLGFYIDAADGVLDGFVGDPGNGVLVAGYDGPLDDWGTAVNANYDFMDVIEAINEDNGGNILVDPNTGVIPGGSATVDDATAATLGFRSVTPYLRQNGTTIDNYNASASSADSFAQIGHGGRDSSQGNLIGDISITSSGGDLHLDAGASFRNHAKIGHGGYGGGSDRASRIEGDITVDVLGDIRLDAGQREDAYAQIGHVGTEFQMGDTTRGLVEVRNADINVLSRQGDIILDADNYFLEYNSDPDNPNVVDPYQVNPNDPLHRTKVKDGPGWDDSNPSTLLVRDLNAASTNTNLRNHRAEFVMIGHGGNQVDVDVDADITVQATNGSIIMESGVLSGQNTQIGHGGQFVDGGGNNAGGTVLIGDITVDAYGDIQLIAGDTVSYFQLFGDNFQTTVPFNALGIVDIDGERIIEGNTAYPNDFTTGGENAFYAFSQIGHGGNRLGNGARGTRIEGDINVNTVLTDRDPDADIIIEAGDGRGAYAMIGHGGSEVDNGEGIFGNITVNSSRDIIITGGERLRNGGTGLLNEENFAQIGHSTLREPSAAVGSNSEGDIYVNAGRDIFLLAGGGTSAHARIGNGANVNSGNQTTVGDHSGDITVIAARDLIMQAGRAGSADAGNEYIAEYVEGELVVNGVTTEDDGKFAFAQIGHGGAGVSSQAGHYGDIDIRVGNNLVMNGPAIDAEGNPILIEIDQTSGLLDVGDQALSGFAFDAYAKIGHGDYLTSGSSASASGFAGGNISVAVGESANISGGVIGHAGQGGMIPIQGRTTIGVSRNDPVNGTGTLTATQSLQLGGYDALSNTVFTDTVVSNFNAGFVGDGLGTPNVGELRLYLPNRAANLIDSGTLLNGVSYIAPSGAQRIGEEWVPYPEFTFAYDANGAPSGSFSGTAGPYTYPLGYGVYYANEFGSTGGSGGGGNNGGGGSGGGVNTGGGTSGPDLPPPPRFTPIQRALLEFYNSSTVQTEFGRVLDPDLAESLEVLREFYGDPSNGSFFTVGFTSQGIDSSDMTVTYPGPSTEFEVFDYDFLFNYLNDIPGTSDGTVSFGEVFGNSAQQESEDETEESDSSSGTPPTSDPFSFE